LGSPVTVTIDSAITATVIIIAVAAWVVASEVDNQEEKCAVDPECRNYDFLIKERLGITNKLSRQIKQARISVAMFPESLLACCLSQP